MYMDPLLFSVHSVMEQHVVSRCYMVFFITNIDNNIIIIFYATDDADYVFPGNGQCAPE